jgi:glucan phosphoethanolaminetransferase (alkaline phosphatase superfamily)
MNTDDDRLINTFEKAAQEYFKEIWEYFWTWVGVVVLFAMVLFGVYFSQYAISKIIGATGEMLYFGWIASISISALEVAGIKLLGNRDRSNAIRASNAGEHKIMFWGTVILFGFDIFTNWYGLWLYARPFFNSGLLSIGAWLVILFFGSVMAVSEIFVGWMFRAIATSYVAVRRAKQKYSAYKRTVDKNTAKECGDDTYSKPSTFSPNKTAWQPKSFPAKKGKMSLNEAKKYRGEKKPAVSWSDAGDLEDSIDRFAESYASRR